MTADAKTPRDVLGRNSLELVLLCAFVGIDPEKPFPPEWKAHYNTHTMAAWKRVADAAAGYQITPAGRDDGARPKTKLQLGLEQRDTLPTGVTGLPPCVGMSRTGSAGLYDFGPSDPTALARTRAAADAVAGVGRDGDAVDAARALVAKLDLIHNDANYKGVWTSFAVHGGIYQGPQYAAELAALRVALTPTTEPGA